LILGDQIEIPKIIYDVKKSLEGIGPALEELSTEVEEGDVSVVRDITDPIYSRCWWRGEVVVGGGDSHDQLTRFYSVRRLLLMKILENNKKTM
jgi:hypothetical protein